MIQMLSLGWADRASNTTPLPSCPGEGMLDFTAVRPFHPKYCCIPEHSCLEASPSRPAY